MKNKDEEIKASIDVTLWKKLNREELIKWISDNSNKIEPTTLKEIVKVQENDPIILKFLAKYNVANFDLDTFAEVVPLLNNNDKEVSEILNRWVSFHNKKINLEIFINRILPWWNYSKDEQCKAAIWWLMLNISDGNIIDHIKKIITSFDPDAEMKVKFIKLLNDQMLVYVKDNWRRAPFIDLNSNLDSLKEILILLGNADEQKAKFAKIFLSLDEKSINFNILGQILTLFDRQDDKLSIANFCIAAIKMRSGDDNCWGNTGNDFFSQVLNSGLISINFDKIFSYLCDTNDYPMGLPQFLKFFERLITNERVIITDKSIENICDFLSHQTHPKINFSEKYRDIAKDYFDSGISDKTRTAFSKFPALKEIAKRGLVVKMLYGSDVLPHILQKAIDEGNEKAIADYFKISANQLIRIPYSNNKFISGLTILEMVKNDLINADHLPVVTDKSMAEIETNQNALCNVLNACCDLAEQLGFEVNKDDPSNYPKFLKNLIKSTTKKGSTSWIETAEYLTKEGLLPQGIKDAVDDYIKTIFLPHHLQGKENYDIDKVLEEFRPKAIRKFFKGVSIDGICKLSNRWHEPGRLAQLFKTKTYGNAKWEPLFTAPLPSYEVEGMVITITPLTTSEELINEGVKLEHCVGAYATICLLHPRHILSLRDASGTSHSTIELQVVKKGDEDSLHIIQHYGKSNKTPSSQCLTAVELFLDDIRSEVVLVDRPMLEQALQNRLQTYNSDPSKKAIIIIGYDHTDKKIDPRDGKTPLEKAESLYRSHGLGHVMGDVRIHAREPRVEDKESPDKAKLPPRLTTNFDILTGKKQEKTKQQKESKLSKNPTLPIVDTAILLTIKNHFLEICEDQNGNKLLKKDINVIRSSKNDEVYINIIAPLNENSLENVKDILGDKASYSSKESEKIKGKITTFTINPENLSEVITILQNKIFQEKLKGVLTNAKAHKLEVSDQKDLRHN